MPRAKANEAKPTEKEGTTGDNLNPLPEEKVRDNAYSPTDVEKKVYDQYPRRKGKLQSSRSTASGLNLDTQMRRRDKNYFNREADIPQRNLTSTRTDLHQPRVHEIQTALGIAWALRASNRNHYSYRNDSIGSSFAAFIAG